MSEPEIPKKAAAEWFAESDRHSRAFLAFIERWPNFHRHIVCAILGDAIALADITGVDVEGFLANLRLRQPRPNVSLVRKPGSSS